MLAEFFATEPQLKIQNFKSFGDTGAALDRIAEINVVIGKNNAGKSAILDAIALLCAGASTERIHDHGGARPRLILSSYIGSAAAYGVIPPNGHGTFVNGSWDQVATLVAQSRATWEIDGSVTSSFAFAPSDDLAALSTDIYRRQKTVDHEGFKSRISGLPNHMKNPFKGLKVVRVAAERNLVAEGMRTDKHFMPDGVGLTGLLANLITSAAERSAIVEEEFRAELNAVLEPDISISAIRTYRQDGGLWEIYVAGTMDPIALSNSGSGLKTVVQTLAALWLMPKLGAYRVEDTIFLFEELENNLHPALQRRLFNYVRTSIEGRGCAFLATHSSVAIDMFNRNENAQIIHVVNTAGAAVATAAHTTISHGGIIDDLDIRASDILQANAIVWVEGPSDRLYFNRWMDLISDGELVEGLHYQCLFYGGRLLSHLRADFGEEDAAEAIHILKANRHAIILMDSDRKAATTPINATKQRIEQEITGVGGYAWITDGREIENEISPATYAALDRRLAKGLDRYDEIEKVLERDLGEDAKPLTRSKAMMAGRLAPLIELDALSDDLRKHLDACATRLRRWSGRAT